MRRLLLLLLLLGGSAAAGVTMNEDGVAALLQEQEAAREVIRHVVTPSLLVDFYCGGCNIVPCTLIPGGQSFPVIYPDGNIVQLPVGGGESLGPPVEIGNLLKGDGGSRSVDNTNVKTLILALQSTGDLPAHFSPVLGDRGGSAGGRGSQTESAAGSSIMPPYQGSGNFSKLDAPSSKSNANPHTRVMKWVAVFHCAHTAAVTQQAATPTEATGAAPVTGVKRRHRAPENK